MARPKGSPKIGGRQKGTCNKVTKQMKDVLAPILNAYMGEEGLTVEGQKMSLAQDLKDMDPADRGRLMKDLMSYVAPKMASMEVKADVKARGFQQELEELSKES